jgi:hypothetical protein
MNKEKSVLNFQAVVDLLNRYDPDTLGQLRNKFPSYADALQPGKMLGANDYSSQHEMLKDLANATVGISKQECESVYKLVSHKLKLLARLRLGSAIISSASSAGIVAALTQGFSNVALVAGSLTFVTSCFNLIAQYLEEYAGGKKSLQEVREKLTNHSKIISEIEFEIQLMDACGKSDGLESTIRKLNTSIAEIRQIQLNCS